MSDNVWFRREDDGTNARLSGHNHGITISVVVNCATAERRGDIIADEMRACIAQMEQARRIAEQ